MYELPIFPLSTVLFPGTPLTLQVFEDRYLALLQKVLKTNQTFGVALIHQGQEAFGPLPEPFKVGCTARIIKVEPQASGLVQVMVVGDERFRILHMAAVDPYLTSFVESLPLEKAVPDAVVNGSQVLRERVAGYLGLLAKHALPPEQPPGEALDGDPMKFDFDLSQLQLPDDPLMLIYMAAALLQVPPYEKQPLLEAPSALALLNGVQRLYRRELAVLPGTLGVNGEQAEALAREN